jgi:hypothetical protein
VARLALQTRIDSTDECLYRGVTPPEVVAIPNYKPYIRLYITPPDVPDGWRPNDTLDRARRLNAIVDTGASISHLPFEVWSEFTGEIRWLDRADAASVRVGGAEHNYRLGRVRLAATDRDGRWMPPAWTLARCLDETDEPIPPLLGLLSPFLMNGRRFHHRNANADLPEWWLEDA